MLVGGVPFRTIWVDENGDVAVIDQTKLPHEFVTRSLLSCADAERAISTMIVRGAPLIGVTAAYGLALAVREKADDASLSAAAQRLIATRPTAVNLRWAVERVAAALVSLSESKRAEAAFRLAAEIAEEDVASCAAIGRHGAEIIRSMHRGKPVNILTHCNAGWLCAVDWGTALAPIFAAHAAGVPVHVWVDETRPRNQGAALTAWELNSHGVPHTLISDNAGGHLMRSGRVDLVITGSDRLAANGDVCNKIGTYLKALAAHDNGVPYYAALPFSTIDWRLASGSEIPIEERNADEVLWVSGKKRDGSVEKVLIAPEGTSAANPAFDVTPARLVSGIITERGVCNASREGLTSLYPEQA